MNMIKKQEKKQQKNFTSLCAQLGILMLVSLMFDAGLYAANKGKKGTEKLQSTVATRQIPVADIIDEVVRDRQELQALRHRYMQEYAQKGMQGNCMELTRNITQAIMTYVNQRIDATVKKLGPAPTKFSLFTMGSMARDESGFFTDLEIGILVAKKDPVVLNYFKRFSQVLADRFFKLGEHPDVGGKGLRIDEGDNAPEHLRWYARYASPEQQTILEKNDSGKGPYEGSRIFVATPQEFANLLDPNLYKKLAVSDMPEKERNVAIGVSSMARNIRHLYGDKALFNQYMEARKKYFHGPPEYSNPSYANRREEIAYFNLEHDVKKHGAPGSAIAMGKLGDTIAPKLTLYRFPEEVLTSLGFWYNVGVQNTAQIADKLVAMKRISPEWGEALKDLMNFTVCLRLKKQIKFGKQIFDIPVTQKGYTELKQKFASQLTMATKNLALATAKKDTNGMMQAEDDILKAKMSMKDLEKMVPGKPDPILTPEIITALNTKYLPMEKKLLELTQKFLAGDKNAFLGMDIGVPIKAAVTTTKPVPVKIVPAKAVKTPVKKQ